MRTIGILGGGAWGTALATVVRRAGRDALLWAREPEVVEGVNDAHENVLFLPGVALDPGIRATGELAELGAADAVLLVAPAQHLRAMAEALGPHLPPARPVVICAKGIEARSGKLLTEVVGETLPTAPQAVLSGPTFAIEVAQGLPTAVTLAAGDERLGETLRTALGSPYFRTYLSDDPIGAEIGGAVKNVIAIASGIVEGRALGDNARAALITRGMAEIARLGLAKGARQETLMGLSGFGDLILTATSAKSRNMSLGLALGRGETLAGYLEGRRSVAEGQHTASAVVALGRALGVTMPISEATSAVLEGRASIDDAIESLLNRPFGVE